MTLEQQRTAAAQALAAVGFQILEMLEGHKEPLGAAWQTLGMSDPDDIARVLARPGRQYGVYPPPGSRLLIADVDRPEVLADFPPLPPTLIVDTARGFHVYARLPDGVEEEDVPRTFAGGEVRIAGSGQVVGPWSLHPSGSLYTPRNGADVGELTADWMAALRRSHQVMNAAWRAAQGLEDAGWYIEHGRHEFLVGRARLMRGHGLTGERLRDELLRLDKERCRPPIATLPGRGVAEIDGIATWTGDRIDDDPPPVVLEPMQTRPADELLNAVELQLRRFVAFQSSHQSAACALWVLHCHAIAAAPMAAYLRVTSAVEESGKTTLIEVLEQLLGPQGINAVSASPASIFRIRDIKGPLALLLDEIDNTLRERKDDSARDLLALINAGYRRSASVLRVVGNNHEPRAFRAFGPAAIAGLGALHPTTESRCIPVVLERKAAASLEPWLSLRHEAAMHKLAGELGAWARSAVDALHAAEPIRPDGIRDRHYEVWWAMLAIADLAGGDWPERARQAAAALHAGRDAETASLGVLLLRHIRAAFEEGAVDRMATADLLAGLVANEEGPWGRWWGAELKRDGAPTAAAADLATKLRPFGVKPHVIRVGDTTPRGYLLSDFDHAFALYLPDPPATPATPATNDQARTQGPVAPVAGVTGVRQTGRRARSRAR